ncbi:MAG TPA: hypothetical protein VE643_04850 [Nitrososphaeraceae archaeon]|nr:hypothetical protein [Nitrososphaeraceae archaeon]
MSSKISVLIIVLLAAASILTSTLQAARAQQPQPQPQTAQGLPIVIVPAIIGNILAVVSFLIGTSSFILGLRIQSAARTTTTGSTSSSSSATLPSSEMHKYFELLILALVIPSIGINGYGILLVGSHLYLPDAPYLSLLFALFIPAGAILFLVKKLHIAYKTNISSG